MDPHTGSMVLTESKKGSSKGCDDHTWKVRISSLQNGQIDLHTGSMVSTEYCKERIVQAVRRHHVEGAFALQMSLIIVDRIGETGDAQTVLVCSVHWASLGKNTVDCEIWDCEFDVESHFF